MDLKKCKRCNIVKPISEFSNSLRTKDKLRYWCRLCESNSNSVKVIQTQLGSKIIENMLTNTKEKGELIMNHFA